MINNKPIRMWPGTLILQCPPCSWDKCVFCGYARDCLTNIQPSTEDFMKQMDCYLNKHDTEKYIEIYNSGSFLDDKQISPESRVAIFARLAKERIKGITIESRPEFIHRKTIRPLTNQFKGELTVAIGLEVADDSILKMLKKGFNLKDVEKAYSVLAGMGIFSRVYILVGVPFVKDPQTAALDSVTYAKKIGFTEICMLGAYPMKKTEGYRLWESRGWLPLKKSDFDRIIRLAQEIEPDVIYSSKGLERFWREEK